MRRRAVQLLTVVTVALVMLASPAWATTFTVNSTADTGDATPDGTCDTCTLREAIQEANANNNDPTVDLIDFAIPGTDCAGGVCKIIPSSELPHITDPVIIDGYSQT
jgi:CSLREA domain-containing protein